MPNAQDQWVLTLGALNMQTEHTTSLVQQVNALLKERKR